MTGNRWTAWTLAALLAAGGAAMAGCSGSSGSDGVDGAQGPQGPPGDPAPVPPPPPTDPNLSASQDLPGVVLQVTALSGASGAGGAFQVGDTPSVTFTVAKGDGSPLGLSELDSGSIYVSGPTTHYQRVLPRATDLRTASVDNGDGTYTYTFASPIPAVYAAPYNDTASFGASDGELAGQALESGTYTLGIEGYKLYYVGEESFRDFVNLTKDFLLGSAAVLEPREVVKRDNCNRCHDNLRVHGGSRADTHLCVLCHTSGAEDKNSAGAAGGTPGTTIEFRVMIHRIHNGKHLPSVLGVGTNADGSRNYAATPKPLQIVGFQDSVNDFSTLGFPVWPNLNIVMPRDAGFSALTPTQQGLEDEMRRGVTACAKCHGDPDGTGPLTAPAQGSFAYSKPTRRACGSCHDDVDWALPYTANGATMPAQTDDNNCLVCHPASGSSLSPTEGHVHPLTDPVFNPGLNFAISSVAEAGTNNGDGTLDPGEKVQVTFTVKNDAGTDIAANTLNSMTALVSGPTTNNQLLLNMSVPVAYLGTGPTYAVNLPEIVNLEFLGTSVAATNSTFTSARAPHWNVTGGATTVYTVGTPGSGAGSSTLSSAAASLQNYVDVASSTNFLRNEYVVVDENTASEEYLRIQTVDGNRLWFNSIGSISTYQPFLRKAHAAGAAVKEMTLTSKTSGTHYTLTAATGTVTELTDSFGANKVVATYTSDFVMPAVYPAPINDSQDLDETWGEWAGKSLADGTYTVALYGAINRVWAASGENTSYTGAAEATSATFLVGSATSTTPYAAISDGTNCYRCHNDLYFHGGGRRGFNACVMCHGTSGFEDRPRYVAPNAPSTIATPVSFRTMLHKIHMGEELPDAATYTVVGFGSTAYPNNYSANLFDEIAFPVLVGGVKNCAVCHGASNDHWKEPPSRDHPAQQVKAARVWRATCGACHSSSAAQAHIDANTALASNGAEACAVCHGAGREWPVEVVHKVR